MHYHLFLPVASGVLQGKGVCLDLFCFSVLTVSCHPIHAVSGMFLYSKDAKLYLLVWQSRWGRLFAKESAITSL